MGRHEIRLRRERMTSRRIEGHKNYRALLKEHQRKSRRNRLLRTILYIVIILTMAIVIFMSLKKLYLTDPEKSGHVQTEIISTPKIVEHVQFKPQQNGKS